MHRALAIGLIVLASAFCRTGGFSRASDAPVKLATDAPQPLPPHESAKRFQLPRGFRIALVAAEPLIADPTGMAFDAKGRIFVCELHGYNLEGYLDVSELNKTGVLDTAVRRIPANPKAIEQARQGQYGTVKLLEDTDGDGRMDKAAVWADHLPPCYGVVAARNGVIVLCAPEIIYLADPDGDGRPEVRQTLFSGFPQGELWTRISNPRWGIDNWIYSIGPGAVRFKADGSAKEEMTGNTGGFGLAINDWGDRFLVTNQQHCLYAAPLPHRYLARNPYYAAPGGVANASTYGGPAQVYPTSQPDPWRLARGKDPAWLRFYGAAEATPNGFFTAASGQCIYQGDRFPAEYYGNHFSVDNAQNMVHRCLLTLDGLHYKATRPREDEQTEFLTSTEQWFRPVNLMNGPDGALYVVDMYRAIIEDYSAIPRFLQQLYAESLVAGASMGRIWKVVADDAAKPPRFDLSQATTGQLVAALSSGNAWHRETAQRLLVERRDKAVAEPLRALAREGKTFQARLLALYTLDGIGELDPLAVERGLGDAHFAVRLHATALAERWLNQQPGLARKVLESIDDENVRVRLQAALTLGELKDPRAEAALRQLAIRDGIEPWMQAAILSSAAETAGRLAAELLRQDGEAGHARALLHPLSSIVGARHDNEELGALLAALGGIQGPKVDFLRVACLKGLIEGLGRGRRQLLASASGQTALRRLMADPAGPVREAALTVARLVDLHESEEMKKALAAAGKTVLDRDRSIDERRDALALFANAGYDALAATAGKVLDFREPLDLQLAAVAALATSDDARVAPLLLGNFKSLTPKAQGAVIDAVFGRQNRLPALLDALEKGSVLLSSLDSMRRVQLLENPEPPIRQRAKPLLAGATKKDREPVLARFRAALNGPHDLKHGKEVFDKQCLKCHQIQGQGYLVGPDLSVTTRKTDDMLVSDVLDPSNQITVGFNNYTVVTEDGRIFTGVLAAETATSVTLRREQAAEDVILRRNIDEMAASPLSLMPENLEKEVTPRDVADLIAFVRQAFGAPLPSVVTLFEDDPAFVQALVSGDGTVSLSTDDRHSGTAALKVTPPQRFNLRITNWEYKITAAPAPGEYRYLRLAWKSHRGEGVMVELAGDGRWPPADKAQWRYYSGKNSTGWAAVQVSPNVPRQWTVITCDLWKDFGAFTLTGIAPTAMGGEVMFDRIELLRSLDDPNPRPTGGR
jgi:putative heme-binding domain-containing protein